MKLVILSLIAILSSNIYAKKIKWESFHKEDGIELFRAKEQKDGIIPFKAIAIIDRSQKDILKVLMDVDRKPEWSPKLKDVKLHKRVSPITYIFSEYYKTPWPFSDREFLLEGQVVFPEPGLVTLFAKSKNESGFEDDDHIQCDVSFLNLNLYDRGPNKTAVSFSFHGDMKGWMPVWLINIIQKKWPMRFIQGLRKTLEEKSPRETEFFNSLKPAFPKNWN